MKKSLLTMTALCSAAMALMGTTAQARNTVVEDALRSRPDLSDFYHGLASTGILNELREDESYTVFAPTNASFSEYPPSQYPCFYSASCRPEVAQILRNHIVPGEKHLSDIFPHDGGMMSLFSLNNHHIIASEPYKGTYTVDGRKVLSENQLAGGVLYRVDGLVARNREMAQFADGPIVRVYSRGTDLPPPVPQGTIVTRTVTTSMPEYSSHNYSGDSSY